MMRVAEAEPAMLAWRALASHATGCGPCRPGVVELRRVPAEPAPVWDRLCAIGRALFEAWIAAAAELAERLRATARPWGMAGLQGVSAEDRAAAITALPEAAARDIWETADEELREAKIAGVVASWRARGTVTQQAPPEPPRARPRQRQPSWHKQPRPVLGAGLDEED